MTCDRVREQLSQYLDGELEDRASVEHHLAQCPRCREELEELRRADAALSRFAQGLVREPPEGFADRVRRRLRRRPLGVLLKVAAVLLVAFGGFVVYVNVHEPSAQQFEVFASGSLLRVVVREGTSRLLANAQVAAFLNGKEVARARTDAMGVATLDVLGDRGRLKVVVTSPLGTDSSEFEFERPRRLKLLLTTDKPIYQPAQTVHARALLMDALTAKPVGGQPLELVVENPNGIKVFRKELRTSEFGIAWTDLPLADELVLGRYRIRATAGDLTAERTIEVKRYVLPKFKVEVTTDRRFYTPGEEIRGRVTARYFFGKPVEGTVQVGGQQMRISGETEFTLRAPVTDTRIEARVTDSAGHTETGEARVVVSESPLLIHVLPYGGRFVPGEENIFYAIVSYPDGRPAKATVRVLNDTIETDVLGVAKFVTREAEFEVTATDGKVTARQRSFAESAQVVLIAERGRIRSGESLRLAVLTDRAQGMAYVDVVKAKQTLLTRSLPVRRGRTDFTLDLPPDLSGTVEVSAYVMDPGGVWAFDRRIVLVESPDDLKVQAVLPRPTFAPGERIPVEFRVTRGGRPVAAALGVAAVDEAVFSVYENYPGLEQVFFSIEENLLKPRYQLQGVLTDLPDRLEGEALNARLSNLGSVEPEYICGARCEDELWSWRRLRRVVNDIGVAILLLGMFGSIAALVGIGWWQVARRAPVAGILLLMMLLLLILIGVALLVDPYVFHAPKLAMEFARSGPPAMGEPVRGMDRPRVREYFPETLYWNPEVITDENGIARIEVPGADSITTWRLVANAVSKEGGLGATQTPVVVFREFFVDLDLPLSLTVGDELDLPVVLYNYVDRPQTVRVVFEGVGEKTVDLQAREVRSVKFRYVAREHGRQKLTVFAYGSGRSDAVRREVEVLPQGRPVERTVSDRFVRKGACTVRVPEDARGAAMWVRLYPSALSEVVQGLQGLVRLPYG